MIRSKALASLLLTTAVFSLSSAAAMGQLNDAATDSIEGYSGKIQVIPEVALGDATIVLTSEYLGRSSPKQLVFQLLHETGGELAAWQGSGRLLASKHMLAVIPGDGRPNLMFRIAESQTKLTLPGTSFKTFTVVGIARYGDSDPLTEMQLSQLSTRGYPSSAYNPNTATPTDSPFGVASGHSACIAGGPNSIECSVSSSSGSPGCSVTCGSGTSSCCSSRGGCTCTSN